MMTPATQNEQQQLTFQSSNNQLDKTRYELFIQNEGLYQIVIRLRLEADNKQRCGPVQLLFIPSVQ